MLKIGNKYIPTAGEPKFRIAQVVYRINKFDIEEGEIIDIFKGREQRLLNPNYLQWEYCGLFNTKPLRDYQRHYAIHPVFFATKKEAARYIIMDIDEKIKALYNQAVELIDLKDKINMEADKE